MMNVLKDYIFFQINTNDNVLKDYIFSEINTNDECFKINTNDECFKGLYLFRN